MSRVVFIDPDGSAHDYLGVIVSYPTGVVYEQQCGGTATLTRSIEGYFVPLGGATFDPTQGRLDDRELTAVFHKLGHCYGGAAYDGQPQLPPDRIAVLRYLVAAVPYWTRQESGEEDVRGQLQLDESRLMELVESWVPVVTPEGPGVLTWPNCD